MDNLGTPDAAAHPLVKARDWLARTAFVVSLVVLLAATYAGLQRRAVLAELQQLDQALAFWTDSAQRTATLQPQRAPANTRWPASAYLQARALDLVSTLCFDGAGEQRLWDALSAHADEQLRRTQVAAAAIGVREPALRGMPRSASAAGPVHIELGATNPLRGAAAVWCARGYGTLPPALATLAAQGLAEHLGAAAELLDEAQREARLRAALDPPATPILRVLGERFSVQALNDLLNGWDTWAAERSWLLDELAREPAPQPDKDRRGYRPDSVALDPYTGQPAPSQEPPAWPVVLAPIEAAARGSPTRYILELGKNRARAADSRAQFAAVVDDELQLLQARRGPVERRGEPEAIAASWGGLQLPLTLFVTIAVLPALGLYLLYALYDAQLHALRAPARAPGASTAAPDFWFPRLGSPCDPLGRPWPRSVAALLPRLFWLLFHAAPLALAYSAAALGLDPLNAADIARLAQPLDALRLLFALLLVLSLHSAVQATSLAEGAPAVAAARRRRALPLLGLAGVAAVPALVVLALHTMLGFDNRAWIFDGALLAALGAVMYARCGRVSNFAWLAYGVMVLATWLPYLRFALQVRTWLGSLVP